MMTTSVALLEVRPELKLNLLASLTMLKHCTPSSVLKDERLSSLPCTVSTTVPEDGLQVAPFGKEICKFKLYCMLGDDYMLNLIKNNIITKSSHSAFYLELYLGFQMDFNGTLICMSM